MIYPFWPSSGRHNMSQQAHLPNGHVILNHQFPARARELGPTRAMTRMALNNQGWHSDIVEDIVLAIDEACQNIIRHAYHGECQDPIMLHIELNNDALVVVLEDRAPTVGPDCMNPRDQPGGRLYLYSDGPLEGQNFSVRPDCTTHWNPLNTRLYKRVSIQR